VRGVLPDVAQGHLAEEVEVPKRDSKYQKEGEQAAMLTVKVQRPHVIRPVVGCGACEKVCPIVDKPRLRDERRREPQQDERDFARKYPLRQS